MIENLPNEIWKEIEGFPNYKISNMGRIQGFFGLITPYRKGNTKYKIVNLYDTDGKSHKFSFHRIVAKHFLPNPDNLPCINHIDENPSNNRVDNLEWCTAMYNIHYGNRLERMKKTSPRNKKVLLYKSIGNELVGEFISISEAARFSDNTVSNLCATIHGRKIETKGYYARFAAIDAALDYLEKGGNQ